MNHNPAASLTEDHSVRHEIAEINLKELYRLPWTMSDNAMTWLEPTRFCNLKCDACFHFSDPLSHKSLKEIRSDMEQLMQLRKCDAMLIAGGEPLTHPKILEIIKIVKSFKVKPVLMTNGVGINEPMIREFKKAGLSGITFHVDSHQKRAGWEGKTESELNELRGIYATMLKNIKGLTCAFNTTIFPDTLEQVPEIVKWVLGNIDKVQILSLIAVRMINSADQIDYFIGNKKIDLEETPYNSTIQYRNIISEEIYYQIKKVIPSYRFNSFLGGTSRSDAPKWVLSTHAGIKNRSFGNLGPRSMEFLQTFHHLLTGNYLGFNKSNLNKLGKETLPFAIFDKNVRQLFSNYLSFILRHPQYLFRPLFLQSITVVQPVDILLTGENDNCDGCPNKTLWQGRLISACRLEEYLIYGSPIQTIPKPSYTAVPEEILTSER
jgi:Radical SAM superfamily/4Fe-4S single cluster domain